MTKITYQVLLIDKSYQDSCMWRSFKLIKDTNNYPISYQFFADKEQKEIAKIFDFDDVICVVKASLKNKVSEIEYKISLTEGVFRNVYLKAKSYHLVTFDEKQPNRNYFEFLGVNENSLSTVVGIFKVTSVQSIEVFDYSKQKPFSNLVTKVPSIDLIFDTIKSCAIRGDSLCTNLAHIKLESNNVKSKRR